MDVVSSIVSAIQLAIAAAPQVASIVSDFKNLIAGLFGAGAIDAATQDALMAHVDAVAAAVAAGTEPPEFQVQPNPGS
jgi:hypothetical protein